MSCAFPVGRLAPSPTGAQHVGNARTYLIAWLAARSRGGRVLLRIEDIDSPRIKPGAMEQALDDLRWLGLDWDGDVIVQTSRLSLYHEALERLKSQNLIYPCTCTRGDIESAASAPHAEHDGPVYPGTCAHRSAEDAKTLAGRSFAWRFRVGTEPAVFHDGFRGRTEIDLRATGGDFVVWKSSGTPAYQLAVVVDDALTGVTEVVRGDDLVASTPRQLLLYRALDWQPPHFVHVPLVVGIDGRRLAKRHGDTRLSALRDAGVSAQALLGLLAWSCGWQGRIEAVTSTALLSHFTFATIPPEPFVLDNAHLKAIGYQAERR